MELARTQRSLPEMMIRLVGDRDVNSDNYGIGDGGDDDSNTHFWARDHADNFAFYHLILDE